MISINIYEISMQIVNFLILLWLVNRYLIQPMSTFLEERAGQIKADIDTAETNKEKSNGLVEEKKELLNQARAEAKKIREEAEDVAKIEKEKTVLKAKEETAQMVVQAKKEIELNLVQAKKQLLTETGDLAIKLSKKVLI